MQINGKNLCDNCFEQIKKEPCPICGYERKKYHPEIGTLPVGSLLQRRYRIGKVLGKGGFGVTYKAYDMRDDEIVAVKEYYPNGMAHRDTGTTQVSVSNNTMAMDFQTGAEKFCEEAKTISRFNGNPNIVGVHDFFYENGTSYFVMEYLDGMDLKHYIQLQGGKLTQENVLHIARVMSDALMITHSMNVLHRDISPDNIYITQDGQIKLIDFGAARQVMSQQSKSLSVILKQGFAPLEQYQRKGKQGTWTDIYALGATLYYALTGEVPNDAMERIDDSELGKAEDFSVDVELWAVINKCMAVRVQDRYEETMELKKDLNKLKVEEQELEKPRDVAARTGQSLDGVGGGDGTVAMQSATGEAQEAAGDRTMAINTQGGSNTHSDIQQTSAVNNVIGHTSKGQVGETMAVKGDFMPGISKTPQSGKKLLVPAVAAAGAIAVICVAAAILVNNGKKITPAEDWEPVYNSFVMGAVYDDDIAVFTVGNSLYYGEFDKDGGPEELQWLAGLTVDESIGSTAVDGDYLYISVTNSGIWRADVSKTDVEYEQIVARDALGFMLYDRCIYYAVDNVLYRAGQDGTSEVMLAGNASDVFTAYEDRIIYYSSEDACVYSIRWDGAKQNALLRLEGVTDMLAVGGSLYLVSGEKLYQADVGTGKTVKKTDNVGSGSRILCLGGKICFSSADGLEFCAYDPENDEKTVFYTGEECDRACILGNRLFLRNIKGAYYYMESGMEEAKKLPFNDNTVKRN